MTRLAVGLIFAFAFCAPVAAAPVADVWLTTADETKKLAQQPEVTAAGAATGDEAVAIDPSKRFQRMHGFGAAITDASAELLTRLPEDKRRAIMAELFGRKNGDSDCRSRG